MTRLQEVEKLIDENLALITQYTKRAAELMGSVRQLEKERNRLMKKTRASRLCDAKIASSSIVTTALCVT